MTFWIFSAKIDLKLKKKKKKRMPHWIFQKVVMRNKFLTWNGLTMSRGCTVLVYFSIYHMYEDLPTILGFFYSGKVLLQSFSCGVTDSAVVVFLKDVHTRKCIKIHYVFWVYQYMQYACPFECLGTTCFLVHLLASMHA